MGIIARHNGGDTRAEDVSTSGAVVHFDKDGERSIWRQIYTYCWFQILLISFICFCCPGVSALFFLRLGIE